MSVDSRYIRIATKFWQDEKARRLSDDAKLLYLYVLTSPHSNMAGYYVLPKPYVAYDLQWLPERLDKAFAELLHQGVIKYCETSDVVLIPNFFKYNPIQNKNQAIGAARRVAELPTNTLTKDFLEVLERFAEPFKEHFAEWFANTETDTDTESETDTVSSSSSDHLAHNRDDDDDDDVPMSEVVQKFSELWGPPNSTHLDMINSYLKDRLTTWHILEALNRAAEANATHPNYIKAILQGWVKNKAYTPDAVRELDKVHERRQSTSNRRAQSNAAEPRKTRYDPDEYREILREAGMLKEVEPVEAGTG